MKLNKRIRGTAEQMLIDYPLIDDYIAQRTEELKHPVSAIDENVGGGKGSHISKPQEIIVITIDDDRYLQGLKKEKQAVDGALDDCDDITILVVKELFWTKHNRKTMDGIAHDVHLTKNAIYRRLNKLYVNILHNRAIYEFANR